MHHAKVNADGYRRDATGPIFDVRSSDHGDVSHRVGDAPPGPSRGAGPTHAHNRATGNARTRRARTAQSEQRHRESGRRTELSRLLECPLNYPAPMNASVPYRRSDRATTMCMGLRPFA